MNAYIYPKIPNEGSALIITNDGMFLHIRLEYPTKEVLENNKQQIMISFSILEGILFFLFQVGNSQWVCTPYNIHLSYNLDPERLHDALRKPLTIMWHNPKGKVVAVRCVLLSENMLQPFEKELVTQQNSIFDYSEYIKRQNAIISIPRISLLIIAHADDFTYIEPVNRLAYPSNF